MCTCACLFSLCGHTATITLTSDSGSQTCVVDGQQLHVICTASNTLFMSWISEEYIGTGITLEFNFRNQPGNTFTSSKVPTTFATFINSSGPVDGVYDLVSQLQIEVLANYTQFTVMCTSPAEDSQKNITFNLEGKRFNEYHYKFYIIFTVI